MGRKLSFASRAEGCAAADPDPAISATEPRVKFIKGWLTGGTDPADGSVECGAGTDYPMQVTLAQLHEIFYRVKIGWVTEGFHTETQTPIDPGGDIVFSFYPPDAAPASTPLYEYYSGDPTALRKEIGYCTVGTTSPVTLPSRDATFGEEYSEPNFDYGTVYIRDILADEAGMWVFPDGSGLNDHPKINSPNTFKTGLSYFVGRDDQSEVYYTNTAPFVSNVAYSIVEDSVSLTYINMDLSATFSGKVAWVNTAGGTGPFASDAQLFLGVEFYGSSILDYLLVEGFVFHTKEDSGMADLGYNFVIRLANGVEVSCPLYGFTPNNPEVSSYSGSDWVLEAKEWWPYAKPDGDPQWDSTTGELL